MDGLRVLERAGVAPADLWLDPERPFQVRAAPGLSGARKEQIKAALTRYGWLALAPADRAPVAAAAMETLDERAWDAFLDATLAARRASGLTWNDPPWKAWAQVIEAGAARREAPIRAPSLDPETARRMTECEKL